MKTQATETQTLVERFLEFADKEELFHSGEKILLAVSGGLDSMVMTSLFEKAGLNFGIAHCNFRMRADESDGDENAVRDLAKKLSVKFHCEGFDTMSFASEHGYSIQQAARILRYDYFEKLCREQGYDKIATAHHLNDSIETFFINLVRGSGVGGLRGIPARNRNIVRPLLFATREELNSFAKENNVVYRTDSSNETDDYLRNRIRHHLTPSLLSLMPDFEEKMREALGQISFVYQLSMQALDEWKTKHVRMIDGEIRIPLELIRQGEGEKFLKLLLHSYGIFDIPANQIIEHDGSGAIFKSNKFELLRDRKELVIRPGEKQEKTNRLIEKIPFETDLGKKTLRLTESEQVEIGSLQHLQQIDAGRIQLPLVVRNWEFGDYFYPLGLKGKKKVSDFFTDIKLSRFEKESTLLLLSGNDIVCILGHRIDERYKITPATRRVLNIEIK